MLKTPRNSFSDPSVDEIGNALNKMEEESSIASEDIYLQDLPEEAKLLWKSITLLDCPFTWDPRTIAMLYEESVYGSNTLIIRIEKKITEVYDDDYFHWHTFILNLVLCYEYCCNEQYSKALSKHRDCENSLIKANDPNNPVHISTIALYYVIHSCKCYLYFKLKKFNDAKQTLQKIQNMVNMDKKDKASIFAIRGALYMEYGYGGTKSSINYLEKALGMDPTNPEWHFLLGKALGRVRRIDSHNSIPDEREIESLEKAVSIRRSASYIIFLAQIYMDTSFHLFYPNLQSRYEMNDKAMKLFMEALKLRSDCSHVNVRCAKGFMMMNSPYRDVALAKYCINKALSLAPKNAMVHHTAGRYYDYHQRNLTKAKYHYRLSGEYGAYAGYRDLLRLNCKSPGYDPLPLLEMLLVRFQGSPWQNETLCQMGSYWYFRKEDFKKAMTYWQQVIDVNPDHDELKEHKCRFKKKMKTINIHEVIFIEAQFILKEKSQTSEEINYWRQMVEKYLESNSKFEENTPKSCRNVFLDSRGRGRGRGRGLRGGSQGRGRSGMENSSKRGHRGYSHGSTQFDRGSSVSSQESGRDSGVESNCRLHDSSMDSFGLEDSFK